MATGIPVQTWLDLDDDRAIVTAIQLLDKAQPAGPAAGDEQMSG